MNDATSEATSETDQAVDFDPFAPETMADPAFMHQLLRESCPVHKFSGFPYPLYSVARTDDVFEMLRAPAMWSSRWGQTPAYQEEPGLRNDPPEHTIFRRLATPVFNARRVAAMQDAAAMSANERLDAVIGNGRMDLYRDFASPVPITVVADLLGVEAELQSSFREWAAEFVRATTAGDKAGEEASRGKINAYFTQRLADRRDLLERAPGEAPDDVVNILVTAVHPEGRPFTDQELLNLALLLMVGGTDTTSYLITNCVYRLLERRELWAQLCSDPGLIEVAVEESLRFDPPVLGLFRTNNEDVTIRGVVIPKDSKVQALFASANRDPELWEDPDTFRLDRDLKVLRQQHFAFGYGIHFCVGAQLARLEAREAIRQLARRLPSLRLRGKPRHVMSYMIRGFDRMPVAWDV